MDHVERAARAICNAGGYGDYDNAARLYEMLAQAVRDADREAGFVLVPETEVGSLRDFLSEAIVLLDNANGISDEIRYGFVERAGAFMIAAASSGTCISD